MYYFCHQLSQAPFKVSHPFVARLSHGFRDSCNLPHKSSSSSKAGGADWVTVCTLLVPPRQDSAFLERLQRKGNPGG
jgi:hypothetical protein